MIWRERTELPNFAALFYVYEDNLFLVSVQKIFEVGLNKWRKKPIGHLLKENVGIKKMCGIYTEGGRYYFVDKVFGDFKLFDADPESLSPEQYERFDLLRRTVGFLS